MITKYKNILKRSVITAIAAVTMAFSFSAIASAAGKVCGSGSNAYTMSIDIGCAGQGNPIMDATFAIIRFLSYGVGLVLIGSLVYAGIQYTVSRGDPKATAESIGRMKSTVGALLLFIFGFAILNYLVPNGVLN